MHQFYIVLTTTCTNSIARKKMQRYQCPVALPRGRHGWWNKLRRPPSPPLPRLASPPPESLPAKTGSYENDLDGALSLPRSWSRRSRCRQEKAHAWQGADAEEKPSVASNSNAEKHGFGPPPHGRICCSGSTAWSWHLLTAIKYQIHAVNICINLKV